MQKRHVQNCTKTCEYTENNTSLLEAWTKNHSGAIFLYMAIYRRFQLHNIRPLVNNHFYFLYTGGTNAFFVWEKIWKYIVSKGKIKFSIIEKIENGRNISLGSSRIKNKAFLYLVKVCFAEFFSRKIKCTKHTQDDRFLCKIANKCATLTHISLGTSVSKKYIGCWGNIIF